MYATASALPFSPSALCSIAQERASDKNYVQRSVRRDLLDDLGFAAWTALRPLSFMMGKTRSGLEKIIERIPGVDDISANYYATGMSSWIYGTIFKYAPAGAILASEGNGPAYIATTAMTGMVTGLAKNYISYRSANHERFESGEISSGDYWRYRWNEFKQVGWKFRIGTQAAIWTSYLAGLPAMESEAVLSNAGSITHAKASQGIHREEMVLKPREREARTHDYHSGVERAHDELMHRWLVAESQQAVLSAQLIGSLN